MKTIYVRAGISPLEPRSIEDTLRQNLIGWNSGNLVYQYSVFRTLMREDTRFYYRPIRPLCNDPAETERLNGECTCAILPLANAFRPGFSLKPLAALVRRLKIPCAVVGIGLQATRPEQIREGFPFDDEVREFVDAVLEKSALLGLRGEYTAEYLQRLGYAPERHFTVIGCPSLYVNGAKLPEPRVAPITPATRFSINTISRQPAAMNGLIRQTQRQYPDFHLVLQEQRELSMLAFGTVGALPGKDGDRTGFYPYTPLHRDVRGDRAIGFTEARSWFDYMKGVDYSFGSRLHGNLAAVIAGTPAFVFTSDLRTEEICRYNNIPHMPVDALKAGTDIRDLLEQADFKGVCRDYDKRFAHFVDFLNLNGISHIYQETPEPEAVPFDLAMARLPMGGYVHHGCLPAGVALKNGFAFYSAKLKKRLKR